MSSRDLLANLEAQLEGWDDADDEDGSSDLDSDDSDEDSDSDDDESDEDSDEEEETTSDGEEEEEETTDENDEEDVTELDADDDDDDDEEDSEDSSLDDESSSDFLQDSEVSLGSGTTTASAAHRRLNDASLDISQQLELQKQRFHEQQQQKQAQQQAQNKGKLSAFLQRTSTSESMAVPPPPQPQQNRNWDENEKRRAQRRLERKQSDRSMKSDSGSMNSSRRSHGMNNSMRSMNSRMSIGNGSCRTHLSRQEMKVRDERVKQVEDSFSAHKRASLQRQLSEKLLEEQKVKQQKDDERQRQVARQEEEEARRAFEDKKKKRYSRSKQLRAKREEEQEKEEQQVPALTEQPPEQSPTEQAQQAQATPRQQQQQMVPSSEKKMPRRSSLKKPAAPAPVIYQQRHLKDYMQQKQSKFQEMKNKQLQEQAFQQQLDKQLQQQKQQAFQQQQQMVDSSSSEEDSSSSSSGTSEAETTTESSNDNNDNQRKNKKPKKAREEFQNEEDAGSSSLSSSLPGSSSSGSSGTSDSSEGLTTSSSSGGMGTSSGDTTTNHTSARSLQARDLAVSSSRNNNQQKYSQSVSNISHTPSREQQRRRIKRTLSVSSGAHTLKSMDSRRTIHSHTTHRSQRSHRSDHSSSHAATDKPYHHGRSVYGRNLTNFPKPQFSKQSTNTPIAKQNYKVGGAGNACSTADKKDDERFWKSFLKSRAFQFSLVAWLITGGIMVFALTQFVLARTEQHNPHVKFQNAATQAIQQFDQQLQHVTRALQQWTLQLQDELQASSSWPYVTVAPRALRQFASNLPQDNNVNNANNNAYMYKHIRSVLVAPWVTPKQWKRFEQYADRIQDELMDDIAFQRPRPKRFRTVLLRWDATKYREPEEEEEGLFVPWQQARVVSTVPTTDKQERQKQQQQYYTHPAYSNAKIVQEWYDHNHHHHHEEESAGMQAIWDSLSPTNSNDNNETTTLSSSSSTTAIHPVLLVRQPTQSELASFHNGTTTTHTTTTTTKNFDYLLQPLVGTAVVEKRLLRPDVLETQIVAVLAVQFRWDLLLQEALTVAFEQSLEEAMAEHHQLLTSPSIVISVTAELQDRCLGEATVRRYNVPIRRGTSGSKRLPPPTILSTSNNNNNNDDQLSPGNDDLEADSVVVAENLLDGSSSSNSSSSSSSFPPPHFTADCPKATFWKVRLSPTPELNEALAEYYDWELYEILMTWFVFYAFVGSVAFYRLYESKLSEEVQEQHWQEQMENEEVDPDEVASAVTVSIFDLAGWQEWVTGSDSNNNNSKSPDQVLSFITSLLMAIDRLAKEHKVVKVKTVGSSMVYASGRPKHALMQARFARDVFVCFQQWVVEWEPTYGPATLELKLVAALETGTLDRRLLVMQGSRTGVNGNAIHKASQLVDSCEAGQILMSSKFAQTLRQYGRGKWVQACEEQDREGTFFMVFNRCANSKTLMRDGSGHSTRRLLSRDGNHSKRSLMSGSQLARSEYNQSKRSLMSGSKLSRQRTKEGVRKAPTVQEGGRDSPPPLSTMDEDRPPMELIDVSVSDLDMDKDESSGDSNSSSIKTGSVLDLGYEDIEPRTFDHDMEDEDYDSEYDEEYYTDDDDDVSNASLEQKQMVIEMAQKKERLIEWSIDLLSRCLEEILAARTTQNSMKALASVEDQLGTGSNILEQCKEFISIPIFSQSELRERAQPGSIPMTDAASKQLRDYVTKIADSYNDHAFHNFEHAANVTACMRKLYNKLIGSEFTRRRSSNKGIMKDHSGRSLFSSISVGNSTSFGIKTDPLIKFSIILCALIHDSDHPGVPNQLLVDENSPMAAVYKKKSIAEQNSVEFSWSLLMRPEYVDLRSTIYCNEKELRRFRQVIVNCVLATDLHDPELQTLRKARWAKAFADDGTAVATVKPTRRGPRRGNTKSMDFSAKRRQLPAAAASNSMLDALRQAATQASMSLSSRPKDDINRKGTIVLEHLLQAADISHTMQNWKVYLKWNERLFDEFFETYESGRSKSDPATFWYQGELDFFDFIVIPLAKKLSSCGIFEEAGEELLENAVSNREEWATKGHEVLEVYVAHYRESHIHHAHAHHHHHAQAKDSASDDSERAALGDDDNPDSGRAGQRDSTGTLMTLSRSSTGSSLDKTPTKSDEDENPAAKAEKAFGGSQLGQQLALLPDAQPDAVPVTPGTATVSVADTISDDGDSVVQDPDIVYAVLDNVNDPDDFFSYTLLTPKQLRKRKERQEKQETATIGSKEAMRERRRRIRRQTSSATNSGVGVMSRANSFHSRSSVFSLTSIASSNSFEDDDPPTMRRQSGDGVLRRQSGGAPGPFRRQSGDALRRQSGDLLRRQSARHIVVPS